MAVYKETKTNTWRAFYRYTDWMGEKKQTQKRGFATKRDALAWERKQLNKVTADLDMPFGSFVDIYIADMKNRIKENTWHTKDHIIRTKILPYFAKRKIYEIQPKDIINPVQKKLLSKGFFALTTNVKRCYFMVAPLIEILSVKFVKYN